MSNDAASVNDILRHYLAETGALDPVPLGGTDVPQPPTPAQNAALCARLAERSAYNRKVSTLIVVLQCITFLVGLVSVLALRSRPAEATAAGGAFVAVLYGTTKRLQRFWAEKSALDLMEIVTPELSPSEVVKMAQAIYFKKQVDGDKTKAVG